MPVMFGLAPDIFLRKHAHGQYVCGAAFDAFSAAAALGVVHYRDSIHKSDGAWLANLFALAALDAAVLAVFHDRRLVVASVLAKRYRALCFHVVKAYEFFGASLDARAAARAVLQIDVGKSVFADYDSAKLAGGGAIAKARATE